MCYGISDLHEAQGKDAGDSSEMQQWLIVQSNRGGDVRG